MALKKTRADARQRMEALAERLGRPAGRKAAGGAGTSAALQEDYWRTVHDLFTRDVTERAIHDLVARETEETFRFFSREVDFTALRRKPWYQRYPLTVWRVYLAMAYRLSPARRILFAVAVPLLMFGWVRMILAEGGIGNVPGTLYWIVGAGTLLLFLLLLELRDKLALKGDLEIARQIQFGLLPEGPLERDGLSIRATMRPANTVGGDYFDLIELGEGRLAVVIGDVAGKGMPAALLMALLQGSLRTLVTAGLRGSELVRQLNNHLHSHIPSNRLVTFFYSELDPRTGELLYVNAGHNAPYILRATGETDRLNANAMALAVVPAAACELLSASLESGDRLVLFTDGATEAFNKSDEEYGEDRLQTFLEARRSEPPEALLQAVIADVIAFCGNVLPHDDMTLVVVDRAS